MQAIFLIAIFSLVITIMAGMMSDGTFNSDQMTDQRIEETRTFMDDVGKTAVNDITTGYFNANPNNATTPADYIKGLPEMRQLSSGRYTDPSLDAWGRPINGAIITEYQSLTASTDTDNNIQVPVTGFLFVSAGPDGVIQTSLTTVTTLTQLYGVATPTDASGKPVNDDIILRFDNGATQKRNLDSLQANLTRIAVSALKELQMRTTAYRDDRLAQYRSQIAAGQAGNLALLDLQNDPNAPRFRTLDGTTQGLANRRLLGVDEEFRALERQLGGGGKLAVSAPQPASPADPLVLMIQNDTAKPTPWGRPNAPFKYVIKIKNTIS